MQQANVFLSQSEFLTFKESRRKSKNINKGEIFAMSGASFEHNLIEDNIRGRFYNFLRGTNCRSFGSNLRISVPANTLYAYPDILVICGKPEFSDDQFDTVLNPAVIIEILSPSKQTITKE